jgi:site-specific DNA-methyltransferase (adenine-specific)
MSADPLAIQRQQILQGDCLTELRLMSPASIDVVVTSPPYNLGIGYRTYNDDLPEPNYLDLMVRIFGEVRRVMRPDASLFLNLGASNAKPWLPLELAVRLRKLFVLQNRITWVKSVTTHLGSAGQFKPINSKRFLTPVTEDLFHFTLNGDVQLDRLAIGVEYADKSNLARFTKSQTDQSVPKPDRRDRGNAWFVPYKTVQSKAEKFDHPAGFPLDLPKWCLQLHGKQDGVVLDPFLGAGTTLVAAEELGMRGIGIEIDPAYAQASAARLRAIRTVLVTDEPDSSSQPAMTL